MDYNDRLRQVRTFIDGEWDNVDLLLNAMKEDLGQKMLMTKPNEQEAREELYYTAKAIDAFAIKLQECINVCKSDQGDY
ncbi:UNVERIFIED_CONTAM: hypothetical protein RF648_18375 [Kocuria sp. CPCC 205274]